MSNKAAGSAAASQSAVWWALALLLGLRLASLGLYPLMDNTEARYADIAQVMFARGDWIFGFQGNYGKGDSYTNGQFIDVNGDGLTDYIRENGAVDLNQLDPNDPSRAQGSPRTAAVRR